MLLQPFTNCWKKCINSVIKIETEQQSTEKKEKENEKDGNQINSKSLSNHKCIGTDSVLHVFDRTCRKHNYEIIRIPVLPYNDMRTYITPINVIINTENKKKVVYMPTFSKADILNEYSQRVWEECGYTVKKVDCSSSYKYSGSLRCLVNILRRE